MSGEANIWQSLQATQVIGGGINFISALGQPTIDVNNLNWDAVNLRLSVKTGGDLTGTDAFNTYYQQDSYLPASLIIASADSQATPGHSVSSSQGTGQVPSYSLAGDYIGQFSAWAYSGSGVVGTYSYRRIAAITAYAVGAAPGALNGLGGELRFGTKLDNGIFNDWWRLTSLGALVPVASGTVDIGAATFGVRKLFVDYTNTAVVGAVTTNKAAGRVNIAAAATSVVVTNSLVTASSLVLATIQQADATAIIKNVVPAAGSFTITLTAAATANVAVGFLVINTDA